MSTNPCPGGFDPSGESRPDAFLIGTLAAFMIGALLAIALSGCAGSRKWSTGDTALAAGYVAATAVDWRQTRDITAGCREINPIVGECGQRVPPAIYFPVMIVGTLGVAAALPAGRWRSAWLGLNTGEEGWTAWSNWRFGDWPGGGQ